MKLWTATVLWLVFLLATVVNADLIEDFEVLEGDPSPLNPLGGGEPLCCGETIYECICPEYFYSSTVVRNVLDDGVFPRGTAPVCVSCIAFAWYQCSCEELYVVVDFWDRLVPDGPVCNLDWLGGVIVDFGTVPSGFWKSLVILPNTIYFPNDDWCVQLRFFRCISPAVYSTVSHVVFANGGPTVGSNDATRFWWDANNNGIFDCPTETYHFPDPYKSQFYFWVAASPWPSELEGDTWGGIKGLFK
ncbi:MAG: hypothetical protein ACUVUU_03455 [bacterium]